MKRTRRQNAAFLLVFAHAILVSRPAGGQGARVDGHASGSVDAVDRPTTMQVEFQDGPARLAGTVFLPEGVSAAPGVVILGGSERGPRTRLKERLAEHLAGAGFVALIYDSAGTGQSTGDALFQTREARAKEAAAAVRCLKGEARTRPDQVGILGFSEGALVTMLAAASDPSVAFAVPVSGGFGVSMTELARYRIEVKGLIRGLKPNEIQKALLLEEILFALMVGPDRFEWRLIDLKAAQWDDGHWTELAAIVKAARRASSSSERKASWDALRRTIKVFRSEPWFDLVVVDVDRFDRFMSMSADYFYKFLQDGPLAKGDFDKVEQELAQYPRIRCPVLAVWGENDEFLPPHRAAAFLKNCLSRAGHNDATFRILLDTGHMLTRDGDDGLFADEFPRLVIDWLSRRFPPRRTGPTTGPAAPDEDVSANLRTVRKVNDFDVPPRADPRGNGAIGAHRSDRRGGLRPSVPGPGGRRSVTARLSSVALPALVRPSSRTSPTPIPTAHW